MAQANVTPTNDEFLEFVALSVNKLTPEQALEDLMNLDERLEAAGEAGQKGRRFLFLTYSLRAAGHTLVPPQ